VVERDQEILRLVERGPLLEARGVGGLGAQVRPDDRAVPVVGQQPIERVDAFDLADARARPRLVPAQPGVTGSITRSMLDANPHRRRDRFRSAAHPAPAPTGARLIGVPEQAFAAGVTRTPPPVGFEQRHLEVAGELTQPLRHRRRVRLSHRAAAVTRAERPTTRSTCSRHRPIMQATRLLARVEPPLDTRPRPPGFLPAAAPPP
jgi:hypothetical protein